MQLMAVLYLCCCSLCFSMFFIFCLWSVSHLQKMMCDYRANDQSPFASLPLDTERQKMGEEGI